MRWHERTRRFVVRGLFLALGLGPAAVVLVWTLLHYWPGGLRREAERLSSATGWHVTLEGWNTPRPGTVLYRGLQAHDPETGELVLRCRLVELAHADAQLTLAASQVELIAARSALVWELIERQLRRLPSPEIASCRLTAGELTWHGSTSAQTFVDLDARLGPTAQGIEADFRFHLAGQERSEPALVRIERQRRAGEATTHVEFNTAGAAIPARAFAPLCDAESWFGRQASLTGHLSLDERRGDWSGRLMGRLAQVDLDTLVSRRFPHALSGRADVLLREAVVEGSRLVQLDATLVAQRGALSRSLLDSLVEHLHLRSEAALPASATTIPYDQLGITFVADRRGLRVIGGCDDQPLGTLLAGPAGVLARQPLADWQPLANLIRALVPDRTVQVPATDASEWLIRLLPVAQLEPARPVGEPRPPRVHVTVGQQPPASASR